VQAERLELAKELRKQITKWTTIADAGIGVLIAGIIVSVLAIGGVLYMTASGTVSEWVLPAAIFTLALFAVSPAVLLLRERPLEGIDKWMPGGKASSDSGDTSDDGGSMSSSGSAGSSASSS
jgi:hypothetical protein